MTTSLAPQPIGPYFDVSAVNDYLKSERDTCARLCAKKLLAGDLDMAGVFAREYAGFQAALDRVWAYWDENHNAAHRWIGWDVQNGWEASAGPASEDPWATPAGFESPDPIVAIDWTSITTDYGRAAASGSEPDPVVTFKRSGPETVVVVDGIVIGRIVRRQGSDSSPRGGAYRTFHYPVTAAGVPLAACYSRKEAVEDLLRYRGNA